MGATRTSFIGSLLLAVAASTFGMVSAAAAAPDSTRPSPSASSRSTADVSLPKPAHGKAAVQALGDQLPAAAALNNMSPAALRRVLLDDSSAWLDRDGRMFYIEEPLGAAASEGGDVPVAPSAPHPYNETFHLHSAPASSRTIYLDFDGHTVAGTSWNASYPGIGTDPQPAFDLDGQPGFNDAEMDVIQEVWRQVSEDYAPFDVDVTTEDPGEAAIVRDSTADQEFGTRVLLTPSTTAATALCNNACGGIAYLDVFDAVIPDGYYSPAWVFTHIQGFRVEYIATTVSHEVGHNFGLQHDGQGTAGYYMGHANWSPLMGGPTWMMSQWSKGEYSGANNTTQDDVALIASGGAPFKPDDHGDTTGAASPLGADPDTTVSGTIGTQPDVDVFALQMTCTGTLRAETFVAENSPNLDSALRLLDSSGAQLSLSNPASGGNERTGLTGLGASIAQDLAPGTYYLEVSGVGQGDPLTTGYTDYGSLGRYELVASACAPPSAPDRPTGLSVTYNTTQRTATLSWSPGFDGGSAITEYTVRLVGTPSPGFPTGPVTLGPTARSHTFTGLRSKTQYTLAVSATNALGTSPEARGMVQTWITTPAVPTAVSSAVDPAAGSVTLTWAPPIDDGGAPVTQYYVRRTGDPAGSSMLPATARSHTFTGVPRNQMSSFNVWATNQWGGGQQALVAAYMPGTPTQVQSLAVSLGSGSREILVTWAPPTSDGGTPLTGYRIETTGPSAPEPVTVAATSFQHKVTGLLPGQSYTVSVRALNAAGEGPATTAVQIIPAEVPGVVERLELRPSPETRTIHVSWDAPLLDGGAAVSAYKVTRYEPTVPGAKPRRWEVSAQRTYLSDRRLVVGRTYRYVVRAVNGVGIGASAQADATWEAIVLPGAPEALQATAGLRSATLAWAQPSQPGNQAITGWNVAWHDAATGAVLGQATTTPDQLTVVAEGLGDGTSYFFTVTAATVAGVGESATSAPFTTFGLPSPPRLNDAVSGVAGGTVSASVLWSAPAADGGTPITGYRVIAYEVDSVGRVVNRVTGPQLPASRRSYEMLLPRAGRYRFAVQAANIVGWSAQSALSTVVYGR